MAEWVTPHHPVPHTPWAGHNSGENLNSPTAPYDLPAVTPNGLGIAWYYDTNGHRFRSPTF